MNYKDRIFVDLHVIDSVDKVEFDSGKTDSAMLKKRLGDTPINIVAHEAQDVGALAVVLNAIAEFGPMYRYPRKAIPYIHIGCHGEKDGLKLTDGHKVSWQTISELLLPLQEKTDYNVPISLSSCWGYHGAGLAYVIDSKYQK